MTSATAADGDESANATRPDRSDERARTGSDLDEDRYTRKQSVLITGCSSGIGRATALAFLDEDWTVVASARDPTDIADLADAGCETITLDVTDPDQVTSVIERTVEETGAIDCLVNNAGYAQMGPLEDVQADDLQSQFDVNVFGPHRLTRAALPHMRAQGAGRIVNVSSIIGRISVAGSGAYAASKHAMEAMSDALRVEVEPFDVDVVLIEPGPVETAFADRVDEELPESRTPDYDAIYDLFEDTQLIGGSGPLASAPEDVADVIVHAATCSEPPARYPVGPVAHYGSYARFLPDRLRDGIYGLVRKLV
ncbi:short-chain alcohol dehydrogenase [Halovivax ruber XH-70]|uniref:Short-chain alcohol dehydrogenase n=1 Tax=Halovivax ruber (strain DSM 18193 / JCM 13892 / XH-70) TaxID=797302 RepID=L0IFY0_HALRX|nr:SDR family oxidoreductase [Halovivax ruber]AGB16862.1 short-chain alcohol dehydrogenase [Halovivax ruber XH-70]